jgi:hypothetical protein
MKKNRKHKKENLMGWNDNVPAIDAPLFVKGFSAFCDGLSSEARPGQKTLGHPITLIEDDGSESVIQITNNPFARGVCAMNAATSADFRTGSAMLIRTVALLDMARTEKAEQWRRVDEETGDVGVHPAVVEAAASLRIQLKNDIASFSEDSFFAAVKTVAERMRQEAQPITAHA